MVIDVVAGRAGAPVDVCVVPVRSGSEAVVRDLTGLPLPSARRLTTAGDGWARVPRHGTESSDADVLLVAADDDQDASSWLRSVGERIGVRTRDDASIATTATTLWPDPYTAAALVAEHVALGRRRFHRYRAGAAASRPARLELWDERLDADALARVTDRAGVVADAVAFARDLVDTPANYATPAELARLAADAASDAGLRVEVLSGADLVRVGLHGLVAVGAASDAPPVAVRLRHRPHGGRHVSLLGKGVTFDTGGLDLKTPVQMSTMKQDMAGAAAVAAATVAAARLDLTVAIDSWLLFCENMPGGAALRPGDVIRHADGTTSEVVSPDAEGRLLLADALHLAATDGADAVVDVATLTGGGGLGPDLWAAVGSSESLVQELLAAGRAAGEPGWQLPYLPGYRRFLRSPVADRRNMPTTGRYPFPTVAVGAYLGEFVGDVPWVHLDISAVASSDEPADPPGPRATGSPTRALVRWLQDRSGADGERA